ncbi:MAG TPA: hypothetical protein PKI10_15240 [Syntrophorhabdus sp.]|jgi:hypothetical protein|nr:hypothetical protein [Syntrophorhabdus sp.]
MRILKIFFFWFIVTVLADMPFLFIAGLLNVPSYFNGLFGLFAVVIATIITRKKMRDGFFE